MRAELWSPEKVEPACWAWPVTANDLAAAARCAEDQAHFLLWNWQRGLCAICGRSAPGSRPLLRDHDHATGLLRGVICTSCNTLEGKWLRHPLPSQDQQTSFDMMAMYREKNPASLLGLRARHLKVIRPRLPQAFEGPLSIIAAPKTGRRTPPVSHRSVSHRPVRRENTHEGELAGPGQLDIADVAARTGLAVSTVRAYHAEATQRRREGTSRPGDLPAPDQVIGASPAWLVATIDQWVANRPGRGAGAGRPRKPGTRRQ